MKTKILITILTFVSASTILIGIVSFLDTPTQHKPSPQVSTKNSNPF